MEVELLTSEHEALTGRFKCGEDSLDVFLRKGALYYGDIGEAKTQVLIDTKHNKIVGYFTLKCSSIKISDEEISDEPRLIPGIEIARFAIDINYQDKDYGKFLFAYVLSFIKNIKENIAGVRIITLFAIHKPKVLRFYKGFEFKEADEDMEIFCTSENEGCVPMYLMI